MPKIIQKQSLVTLLVVSLVYLSFSLIANAEEITPNVVNVATSSREASATTSPRANFEKITPNNRAAERQDFRNERQSALEEVRQKRVLNLSANISNRMEAAITRFYDLINRLEARITKLKAVGIDTGATEEKLRQATQLLSEARAALSNIDILVKNATSSTQPKTDWQEVRATYLEAGRLIRECHQSLKVTITLLKAAISETGLRRSNEAASSSTSSSTRPE